MINITKTTSVINPDDKVFDHNAFLVRRKSDGDFLALIFCTKYKDIYICKSAKKEILSFIL